MEDLKHLQEWSNRWQMVFKLEKCFVMSITNKINSSLFSYSMSGTRLAALIDSKLNWKLHCDNVSKGTHVSPITIQQTLHAPPQKAKQVAYQTLIRPKLEYASAAWSPHTRKNLEKI